MGFSGIKICQAISVREPKALMDSVPTIYLFKDEEIIENLKKCKYKLSMEKITGKNTMGYAWDIPQ